MIDNTPNTKLDEAVKNALKDFEAPYDSNDWSRMDSMLNVAPKQTQFNWKYSLNIVVGIAILGGGFLIYKQLSKPSTKTEEITPPAIQQTTKTPTPIITKKAAEIATPTNTEIEVKATESDINEIPLKTVTKPEATIVSKEKNKTKETNSVSKKSERNTTNIHSVMKMGNEPIFGDMLDSSKGVIGTTQEKDETKKAAKSQSNKNIGWDNIMFSNVNPDSIRKHREAIKKDTLKN